MLGFPTFIHKIGIPFVGLLLFFITLLKKRSNIRIPLIGWIVLFIVVSILSKILNEISVLSLIMFLFLTLLPYIYFIVIINESSVIRINLITKWIIILVLLQIPVIFVKYAVMGQSEKGAIGTLSIGYGSLSTVFPVLIIAFLISFYLMSNKFKYVILIFLFVLFGIIGNKRAITFIIPLEFIIGYFLYLKYFVVEINLKQIRKLVFILLLGFIALYTMVRASPSLNKDQVIWGEFDLEYLINYSNSYTSSKGKGKTEMRRKEALIYFINYNLSSDVSNFLIGDGAGILVQSLMDKKSGTMGELYGIRYGGRMGIVWLLLQVGIIGVIIYIVFFIKLNIMIFKKLPRKNNYLLLSFAIASIFLTIDILIYSSTFMEMEIVNNLYFYTAALLVLQYHLLRGGKKLKLNFVNSKIK